MEIHYALDMKRFLLTSCLIAIAVSLAEAGSETYSSKETVPPPCPSWYADKEWNVNLWATYAFPHNDYPTPGNTISQGRVFPINGGSFGPLHDTYLEADHAWGGGIDLKYFLSPLLRHRHRRLRAECPTIVWNRDDPATAAWICGIASCVRDRS